jgi:hypothetical protein
MEFVLLNGLLVAIEEMDMMKHSYYLRVGLAAFGIVLASAVAHAQAPTKAQPKAAEAPPPSATAVGYAKEILDLKNVSAIYQTAVPALVQRAKQALVSTNLNLSKDLDEAALKVAKDLAGREKEVGDQFVKIYSYTFSESELKEILAFYKTATGKKVIELEPVAYQEANRFMTEWATLFQQEADTKMRAEMKARGKPVF